MNDDQKPYSKYAVLHHQIKPESPKSYAQESYVRVITGLTAMEEAYL